MIKNDYVYSKHAVKSFCLSLCCKQMNNCKCFLTSAHLAFLPTPEGNP